LADYSTFEKFIEAFTIEYERMRGDVQE